MRHCAAHKPDAVRERAMPVKPKSAHAMLTRNKTGNCDSMKAKHNQHDGQVIYLVVLALFGMAVLATLGESLVKVLWSGFGIVCTSAFIWLSANRSRHT